MRRGVIALVSMIALLAGCFTADVTLNDDGSGTVALDLDPVVKTTEKAERGALTASGITVQELKIEQSKTPAQVPSSGQRVKAKVAFKDVTKLNQAKRFAWLQVKVSDAGEGKKRVEATIKTPKTNPNWKRTDPCTIRVHLPGDVVETSALKEGNTVVWTFPSKQYFTKGDKNMTAVYKTAAAKPATGKPAADN